MCCLLDNHRIRQEAGEPEVPLEGGDSWRLHKQQDPIRTSICPKIRPNVPTIIKGLHIEATLQLISKLLQLKTSYSAHFDKLQILEIHLMDHPIFNCIELLASFQSCKEVRECVLIIDDISTDRFAHTDPLVCEGLYLLYCQKEAP